jgi:hypothetical protein
VKRGAESNQISLPLPESTPAKHWLGPESHQVDVDV